MNNITTSQIHSNAYVNDVNAEYFNRLNYEFSKYHQDPYNVLIHLLTTPLGVVGAFSILRKLTGSSSISVCLCVIYLLNLVTDLSNGIYIGTACMLAFILYVTRISNLSLITSISCIVLGYVLQDLAHLGTGEATFQSTYSDGGHIDVSNLGLWSKMLTEHIYYLIPLVIAVVLPYIPSNESISSFLVSPLATPMQQLHSFAWLIAPLISFMIGGYCLDTVNAFSFFPGFPYFNRLGRCNIANPEEGESRKEDLKAIRDWTLAHNPSTTTSSHWWYQDLDNEARSAFDRCANSDVIIGMFRKLFNDKHYAIDIVEGMNEIYVTGPSRMEDQNNSDQVFYSRHVDGPWSIFPFVSVYRCIVGMDKNYTYTTHFPLANVSVNACEGDVLAFDFNRELHYITSDDSKKNESDDFRVVLKLHYCMYPKILAPLGWLMHFTNVRYNRTFRALFLKTIEPNTLYEKFLAWNVNFSTNMFNWIETYVGQRNIVYIIFIATLWWITGVYEVFFALTSYVHYFRYITTFYVRRDIDFGSFKRDVLLFKSLALLQLFLHYFFPVSISNGTKPFVFDVISVVLIVSGYFVSVCATNALGIDRTYFGAELGLMESKWITQFPYGYIPHPMILSQVVALLGFHKADHFRANWPYVVPIHVFLYFVHMMQEHFDIYQKAPRVTDKRKAKIL